MFNIPDAVVFEYIKLIAPLIFFGGLATAVYVLLRATDASHGPPNS
jgi:hypothetical protein